VIYETPEQRAAQLAFVEDCARWFKVTPWHQPTLAPIDAYLLRQRAVVGTLEVKRRKVTQDTYPTCWVERVKVDALLRLTPDPQRAAFAVRWNDRAGWVRAIEALTFPLVQVSLARPRDAGDVDDWVYDVPTGAFILLPVRRWPVVASDDWSLTP